MTSYLIDANQVRKNKIILSDYDFAKDIENRLIMSQFASTDLEVLEEILYSSLTVSIQKIAKNLEIDDISVKHSLEKLSQTGLLKIEKDQVLVDKEMRKYFEAQIQKFDEDFTPGMDFLQSLLRKVPIHHLPMWYSIPRTSNNIFESIIEKYLLTPQLFQRYLMDLTFSDPILRNIIDDVYQSEDFEVLATDLIDKYQLTKEQFEEHMLTLEFNFVLCLGYKKINGFWHEKVTPFHEWKEYLLFLKKSELASISPNHDIVPLRPYDFSFVQDLGALLEKAKKSGIAVSLDDRGYLIDEKLKNSLGIVSDHYIHHLISKALVVRLAVISSNELRLTDKAFDWLDMGLENRAMYLYRHPLNKPLFLEESETILNEKSLREAEKSIVRAVGKQWVYYDEFIKGVSAPLRDDAAVSLKRFGRIWKYCLPEYSQSELNFISKVILQWLFEAGIVMVGEINDRTCFRVTSLGSALFAR